MKLNIQLYSLIISFFFGGLFSLELIYFDKLFIRLKHAWRFLFSFTFVIVNSVIYFLLLLLINNGILHIYFFIMLLLGYLLFNVFINYVFTHFRKKS